MFRSSQKKQTVKNKKVIIQKHIDTILAYLNIKTLLSLFKLNWRSFPLFANTQISNNIKLHLFQHYSKLSQRYKTQLKHYNNLSYNSL